MNAGDLEKEPIYRLRVWRLRDGVPVLDKRGTKGSLREYSTLFYFLLGNAIPSDGDGKLDVETTGPVPFASLMEREP